MYICAWWLLLKYFVLYFLLCSVLFPGGGVYLNQTTGYPAAAQKLYKLAVEVNPIYGTFDKKAFYIHVVKIYFQQLEHLCSI